MIENFYLVGQWDGSHIWCQWDDSGPLVKEWKVRLSLNGVWQPLRVCSQDWFRQNLPQGYKVQAQIMVGPDEWVPGIEARFIKSTCLFEFQSARRDLHYVEGSTFARVVDGAPCLYRLKQEIEIPLGSSVQAEMEATTAGGWAQLDAPGDFLLRPQLGVVIRNLEPSKNNLEPTGRDFTMVAPWLDGPPVSFALNRPALIK